tara:strand:+ start:7026 stop:7364 length:339 start_codon:yes stop_codon:yes gene_type:complete
MKSEKELQWLVFLYNSPYCSYLRELKIPELGCKKDFEKIVHSSENSREFTSWFKILIDKNIIIFKENIIKGDRNNIVTKGYFIDGSKLQEELKNHKDYKKYFNAFMSGRLYI